MIPNQVTQSFSTRFTSIEAQYAAIHKHATLSLTRVLAHHKSSELANRRSNIIINIYNKIAIWATRCFAIASLNSWTLSTKGKYLHLLDEYITGNSRISPWKMLRPCSSRRFETLLVHNGIKFETYEFNLIPWWWKIRMT